MEKRKPAILKSEELPRILYPVKMWFYEHHEIGKNMTISYRAFHNKFTYYYRKKRDTDFIRLALTRQKEYLDSLQDERRELKDLIRETSEIPSISKFPRKTGRPSKISLTPEPLKKAIEEVKESINPSDKFRPVTYDIKEEIVEDNGVFKRSIF